MVGRSKTKLTDYCLEYITCRSNFTANLTVVKVKVKLFLGLIYYAPRREDVSGSGGTAPKFLTSALYGGGQLHALAALHPGKIAPRTQPIGRRRRIRNWSGRYEENS
jgi:hypothetical protein